MESCIYQLFIFILISCIYFILMDELVLSLAQRRIGPFNIGWYGILSSIINGCNLIITQLIIPKLHFYFGFQLFPIVFFLFTTLLFTIIYPFYLINLIFTLILLILISGLSIVFIILSATFADSRQCWTKSDANTDVREVVWK